MEFLQLGGKYCLLSLYGADSYCTKPDRYGEMGEGIQKRIAFRPGRNARCLLSGRYFKTAKVILLAFEQRVGVLYGKKIRSSVKPPSPKEATE